MARAYEVEVAVLAGAKALLLVFEDVGTGPGFLEVDELAFGFHDAGQLAFNAHSLGHIDDFLAALVVEVDGLVVNPVGPFFCEHGAGDDALVVLADFDEFALLADDFAFAFLQLGGDGLGDGLRVTGGMFELSSLGRETLRFGASAGGRGR